MELETGYYANQNKWTKVHLVDEHGPICKSKMDSDMQFQFCAAYPVLEYIECKKCKELYFRQKENVSPHSLQEQ
jgi:hypothetical protein